MTEQEKTVSWGHEQTVYWGLEDHRCTMTATDIDEAVANYLIDRDGSLAEMSDVTFYEYTPLTVDDSGRFGDMLDEMLVGLDEDLGDPNANLPTEPSKLLVQATELVKSILRIEYIVWVCERTSKQETVNLLEWAKAHDPGRVADELEAK